MFQKIKIKHLNSLKENKGEYMGLLDIFKKSKKVDVTKVENNLKTVSQKTVSKQTEHRLDLTKKIDNSFKKLNLDKPEILSNALFLLDVSIPEPNGSTNLAGALRYIKYNVDKPNKIVLVSDGEPDNELDAWEIVQ